MDSNGDMADGDSSVDDLIGSNIPIYQRGITGGQELQSQYPGGIPHSYFSTTINGVKSGRYVDVLDCRSAHESKVILETH